MPHEEEFSQSFKRIGCLPPALPPGYPRSQKLPPSVTPQGPACIMQLSGACPVQAVQDTIGDGGAGYQHRHPSKLPDALTPLPNPHRFSILHVLVAVRTALSVGLQGCMTEKEEVSQCNRGNGGISWLGTSGCCCLLSL